MRLGDLDALRDVMVKYAQPPTDMHLDEFLEKLDAAPTVSCAECEHFSRDVAAGWDDIPEVCLDCWCASNFQRRHTNTADVSEQS